MHKAGGEMPLKPQVQGEAAPVVRAYKLPLCALELEGHAVKRAALRRKAAGPAHYIPKPGHMGLGHIHRAV